MKRKFLKMVVFLLTGSFLIGLLPAAVLAAAVVPGVSYRTHVQNVGWQKFVSDGAMSGTSGKGLRLEGIEIKVDNLPYELGVSYQTHIQNIGWEAKTDRGWKNDGEMSGTSGLGYRLEAVQIKLTGEDAGKFDIYYQVHAENFGWLGWAKNGESSGTAGYGYRLEGIKIQIVPKGQGAPSEVKLLPFYDKNENKTEEPTPYGKLKVSYIDVGQADSVLIQQGDHAMLIDAGNDANADMVKNYLKGQGVTALDYAICTHPHDENIGGMDTIVNAYKIGKIYAPEASATTQIYRDLQAAVSSRGLQFISPVVGSSFKLGDATCTILGPINSSEAELNTYSIVLKVAFGENSFLFTGDAEHSNEQEMLVSGYDLLSDVLKVSNHGTNSSTSLEFLNAVNPSYAVISVGKDKNNGLLAQETLNRILNKGIDVFKTNEKGTIVATSDGSRITFNVSPTESPVVDPEDYIVYKTYSGRFYHKNACADLGSNKIPLLKSEALGQGLTPCSLCNP